jgi:hypothetical protein
MHSQYRKKLQNLEISDYDKNYPNQYEDGATVTEMAAI